MWGILTLNQPEGSKFSAIPVLIDLDVSKSSHFIGRVPNPAAHFQHRIQHVIPLAFMSSTHCSISVEFSVDGLNHRRYLVTDYSTNGTFVRRASGDEQRNIEDLPAELVGNENSVEICNGDFLSFKFKGSPSINYEFQTQFLNPLGSFLTHIDSTALPCTPSSSSVAQIQAELDLVVSQQVSQLREELTHVEDRLRQSSSKTVLLQQEVGVLITQRDSLQHSLDNETVKSLKLTETLELSEGKVREGEIAQHSLQLLFETKSRLVVELHERVETLGDELKYKQEQLVKKDVKWDEANKKFVEEMENRLKVEEERSVLQQRVEDLNRLEQRLHAVNAALQAEVCDRIQDFENLTVSPSNFIS